MTRFDLRPFIAGVRGIVASHALGPPGAYRRWNWQDERKGRDLGLNPYGCADAANLLYTIGDFPADSDERQGWVRTLQGLQEPETGFFREPTHHEIHTTAHCIAALELFDARPRHPIAGLAAYREPAAMVSFLEQLPWRNDPWNASHRGAGLYVALVLTGAADADWEDRYFAWLADETDPATGFLRRGCVGPVDAGDVRSIFPHLAGTFHYLFNQEYARRPLAYPGAMAATCLDLFARRAFPLGKWVGFAEIDWVYCLARSVRQCGQRFAESRQALTEFAAGYLEFLAGLDPATHDGLNDLHALFGALCCLADLQTALPGLIRTERPLRLVLDRRPFI